MFVENEVCNSGVNNSSVIKWSTTFEKDTFLSLEWKPVDVCISRLMWPFLDFWVPNDSDRVSFIGRVLIMLITPENWQRTNLMKMWRMKRKKKWIQQCMIKTVRRQIEKEIVMLTNWCLVNGWSISQRAYPRIGSVYRVRLVEDVSWSLLMYVIVLFIIKTENAIKSVLAKNVWEFSPHFCSNQNYFIMICTKWSYLKELVPV